VNGTINTREDSTVLEAKKGNVHICVYEHSKSATMEEVGYKGLPSAKQSWKVDEENCTT